MTAIASKQCPLLHHNLHRSSILMNFSTIHSLPVVWVLRALAQPLQLPAKRQFARLSL
jgi:hypothetical protein